MIYDHVSNLGKYAGVHPAIAEIASTLDRNALLALAPGEQGGGEGWRLIINDYETAPGDKPYEYHKREADLQVMLSGRERIHYSKEPGDLGAEDFKERDIAFKEAGRDESCLLSDGMFAIYLPGELHAPGVAFADKPERARKAVFKLKFE